AYGIVGAKRLLYEQLQELTLSPPTDRGRWLVRPGRLEFHFGAGASVGAADRITLEDGVAEVVTSRAAPGGTTGGALQWSTVRLEFDPARGWDQRRAARWLEERAGICDLGRTQLLD